MTKPRVIIADDHSMFVDGISKLLQPEVDLVETVEDGRALLAAVARVEPDIVVADISMPKLNGLDATKELKKDYPDTKVIILTMHASVQFAESAFRAGANGYVVKHCAVTELIAAIREVQMGRYYLTPLVARDVLTFFMERVPTRQRADILTPRQREVVQLVAEGYTVKGIAAQLNISPKTAESHRYSIMKQLDLHTTAELTQYAIQEGIISIE